MAYRIEWDASADRQLRALERKDPVTARRVGTAVDALADEPRPAGCVKVAGEVSGYRIRIGAYRVLYRVTDAALIVVVVRVGKRDHVYD